MTDKTAPKDIAEQVKRARILMRRINRDEAELKMIKDSLKETMEHNDVARFVDNHGVVLVNIFDRTSNRIDRQKAESLLSPRTIGRITTSSTSKVLSFPGK